MYYIYVFYMILFLGFKFIVLNAHTLNLTFLLDKTHWSMFLVFRLNERP